LFLVFLFPFLGAFVNLWLAGVSSDVKCLNTMRAGKKKKWEGEGAVGRYFWWCWNNALAQWLFREFHIRDLCKAGTCASQVVFF
jgi:hypothetical protein